MKIATKIAGFLMSCLTLCTALQPVTAMAENTEMARPRSTIDLSRTDRLTGTPGFADTPGCPSGQVLSGGVCVLISNQAAGIESWVKHFIGQRRCADSYVRVQDFPDAAFDGNVQGCVEILQTGEVKFSRVASLNPAYARYSSLMGATYLESVYATPWQNNSVKAALGSPWSCGPTLGTPAAQFVAWPLYTNDRILNGQAPYDWTFSLKAGTDCSPADNPNSVWPSSTN